MTRRPLLEPICKASSGTAHLIPRAPVRTFSTFLSRRPQGAARAADSAAWPSLPLPLPLRSAKLRRSAGAKRSVRGRHHRWKVSGPRRFDTGSPRGGSHRANAVGLEVRPIADKRTSRRPRVKSPLRCAFRCPAAPGHGECAPDASNVARRPCVRRGPGPLPFGWGPYLKRPGKDRCPAQPSLSCHPGKGFSCPSRR